MHEIYYYLTFNSLFIHKRSNSDIWSDVIENIVLEAPLGIMRPTLSAGLSQMLHLFCGAIVLLTVVILYYTTLLNVTEFNDSLTSFY